MGLTPAAGLPGGTRSGDIDPTLVFHYTHDAGKPSPSSTKEMHITTVGPVSYPCSLLLPFNPTLYSYRVFLPLLWFSTDKLNRLKKS